MTEHKNDGILNTQLAHVKNNTIKIEQLPNIEHVNDLENQFISCVLKNSFKEGLKYFSEHLEPLNTYCLLLASSCIGGTRDSD